MQAQLNRILEEAKVQLQKAEQQSQLEEIRVKLLGKKGELTQILRGMGQLSPEERKETGALANRVRGEIEQMLSEKVEAVKNAAKAARFKLEKVDVTEPGKKVTLGVKHPLTITMEEISRVFMNMGFSINPWDSLWQKDRRLKRYSTISMHSTRDRIILPET